LLVSVLSPPRTLHPTTGVSTRASLMAPRPSCLRWLVSLILTIFSSLLLPVRISSPASDLHLQYYSIDAFSLCQSATSSVLDDTTGLLRITSTQYSALENLNFNVGSVRHPFCLKSQYPLFTILRRTPTLSPLMARSGLVPLTPI
jgi:hypothetical protein